MTVSFKGAAHNCDQRTRVAAIAASRTSTGFSRYSSPLLKVPVRQAANDRLRVKSPIPLTLTPERNKVLSRVGPTPVEPTPMTPRLASGIAVFGVGEWTCRLATAA